MLHRSIFRLVAACFVIRTSSSSIQQQQVEGSTKEEACGKNYILGSQEVKDLFLLNYTNFNHGSFGACPKSVLQFQQNLRLQQEQQPDPWMRHHYRVLVNDTRAELASYLGLTGSDNDGSEYADTLVLVESASTAINSVLRSFPWQAGDIILYFDVAYAMVKNTAIWLKDVHGIEIFEVPVQFPIAQNVADDAFLRPLEDALETFRANGRLDRLKMVVLDHVSSAPAVREPIQRCAELIKDANPQAMVVIDGAHAMGMVADLEIPNLAPIDVYLSNGHKWLYSPKGSAILWFNSTVVTDLFPEPTVVSSANAIRSTSLSERYSYVSVRDYTAFISMSEALKFREMLGGDNCIHSYTRELAISAKYFLLELWGVESLIPDSMEEFMINIPLPAPFGNDMARAVELEKHLLAQHGIYTRMLAEPSSGLVYTRLSAQVYLSLDDFVHLGHLVVGFSTPADVSTKW